MVEALAARFPTVKIETHGCKLNMADSQRLARAFFDAGFTVISSTPISNTPPAGDSSGGSDIVSDAGREVTQAVAQEAAPDVYVLNSCTVTHVADRKARRALSAARRAHPGALVVAAGCFAERSPSAVEALGTVDLVVTNREKPQLVERVTARLGVILPILPGHSTPRRSAASPASASTLLGRTRAFIKIQEGCNQVCAYCIVPRVRGRERSVPADDLVGQVRAVVEDGLKEVVLTGTQLGTYGFDLPADSLKSMLSRLLSETDIARIRVSSLQPLEMTDDLLELWSGQGRGRLCPHFHMPLQSGSDPVLSRMRRRYTASQYLEAAARAREAAPGAAITADVIAGFPGERPEDHVATIDTLRAARLAGAHVFPFSPRPGTSAARFADQVPPAVRMERAAELRAIAEASAAEYRESLVGETRPVLWETVTPVPSGLADNYVRVEVVGDGPVPQVNAIDAVRLVSVRGDRMVGRLVVG